MPFRIDSGAVPGTPQQEQPTHEAKASATKRDWLPKTLLPYLRSVIGTTRWQFVTAIGMMVLTSLTEGFGVALLFPILRVAGFDLSNQGHVGHYTAEAQNLLVRSGLRSGLWLATLLLIFLLLMGLRSLFARVQSLLGFSTVLRYEMTLSRQLYGAIINAQWPFLARRRASDFTHALTGELGRVASCTSLLMGTLSNAILALVYVAIALKLSVETTVMVLGAGISLLFVSRRWMRAVYESGSAVSDSVREVYSAATEHLQNLKAMKTYDAQTTDLKMFASLQSSAIEHGLQNMRSQSAATFWFEAGSLMLLGGVIFASIQILRVAPGSILLLLVVFTRLMPRLAVANSQLQAFLSDLPAFESVSKIYRDCTDHVEASGGNHPNLMLKREIQLESIHFQYEVDRPPVLDDLTLTIVAGKITAVTGPSGTGKSTIADLVNGLLSPSSGRILVDGEVLTPQLAHAWRRQVGYVAQDTVLFHDTVRANLLWAQPNASTMDLHEALVLAAAEFVFDLPRGLDTTVGDRGILLSNGQRQRVALARALLRKPTLLILDEATNSLDVENEKRILDAIDQLKGSTTVLLIAHRASAVQHADMIYVIDRGRVVEAGHWSVLGSQTSDRIQTLFRVQDVSL
jgi:ATP-binding cassette, subfamily C, bacterial